MKEKNLVVENLKKLLAEQVSLYRRRNLVKNEKFSEMLSRANKAYLNGMLSNEEVITELMKMAKDIANAQAEGDAWSKTAEKVQVPTRGYGRCHRHRNRAVRDVDL